MNQGLILELLSVLLSTFQIIIKIDSKIEIGRYESSLERQLDQYTELFIAEVALEQFGRYVGILKSWMESLL